MAQRWLGALWSGDDRRQRQRVALYFNCRWLGPWGEERARISSLSPTGCYIESRFSVPPEGEPIQELTIVLPTETIHLQGTVLDSMPGVGFAVRFTDLDEKTRDCLSAVIQDAHR